MELSLIADTITVFTAKQGIAFGKSLLQRLDLGHQISLTESSIDHQSQASSAIIFPVDSTAPPPVRSSSYKTIRRIRKKRRTKRVSFGGDDEGDEGGDFSLFLLDGGGSDGPFGFGGGGNGKGWNYGGGGGDGGGFGDESSFSSWSGSAMEFVYEVICWIALSNCVHFAFKRVVRIVTDGEREKLNITLSSVC